MFKVDGDDLERSISRCRGTKGLGVGKRASSGEPGQAEKGEHGHEPGQPVHQTKPVPNEETGRTAKTPCQACGQKLSQEEAHVVRKPDVRRQKGKQAEHTDCNGTKASAPADQG